MHGLIGPVELSLRRRLTAAQARRIVLFAQGFADAQPAGRVDVRHIRRVLARTGFFQIDSVNVLQRAHYLPAFSRLGPYPTALIPHLAYKRRELFEYWVHEASYAPVALHPLMRHRMAARGAGKRATALLTEDPKYIPSVLREVAARGPVRVADLPDPGTPSGSWWGWSKGKVALEHLFSTGQVGVAHRERFTRYYDITERVIPAEVLALPTPGEDIAGRELIRLAGLHLGVATVDDLADYYRLPMVDARRHVANLVRRCELEQVQVANWNESAYMAPNAHCPRRIDAAAMISPFDPLMFHRPRALRLFAFHYRIEIYVPKPQRTHGYYVLPFLHGDTIVGRADLKADRARRHLQVLGAWWEPGTPAGVAGEWWKALRRLADWLELDEIMVVDHGDAAPDLMRLS